MSNGRGIQASPASIRNVNRGASICQGLVMACPFSENGSLTLRDLAGGLVATSGVAGSRTARGFATTPTTQRYAFPQSFPRNIGATSTDPFTVSLWLNRTTINSGTLFGWALAGGGSGWYCQLNAVGTGLFNFDYFDSAASRYYRAQTSSAISTNVWYHLVCLKDSTHAAFPAESMRLYLNGLKVATTGNVGNGTPASISLLTYYFSVGSRGASGTISPANINNFAMWNRALTDNEIYKLYTQPYCLYR